MTPTAPTAPTINYGTAFQQMNDQGIAGITAALPYAGIIAGVIFGIMLAYKIYKRVTGR